METEYQVSLIIYKNFWISFTLKILDSVCFLQYLYFYTLSVLYVDRGAMGRVLSSHPV
jgi:hypothetical protein